MECTTVNGFVALEGFRLMGWEKVSFVDNADLVGNEPDEVVVAYIDQVRHALRGLSKEVPAELGHPAANQPFLGRRMWQSTVNAVARSFCCWNG